MVNIAISTMSVNTNKGQLCKFAYEKHTIRFTAPIVLYAGDHVFVNTDDGQPMVIYRDNQLLWAFQPEPVHGVLSGTFDENELRLLQEIFQDE